MVNEVYNTKFTKVKEEIIKFLILSKDRVAHESALFLHLGISSTKDKKTVRKVLNKLIIDGSITMDKKKRMIRLKTNEYEIGEVILNGVDDFAIRFKDRRVSIKSKHLNGSYVGDKVLYSNKAKEIRAIMEKKNNPIVFSCMKVGDEIKPLPVSIKSEDEYRFIDIDNYNLVGNEVISANVKWNEEDNCFDCKIREIIGDSIDSDKDILGKIVLASNGFDINFPSKVLEEADLIPKKVYPEDMEGRVDLRSLKSFTLDCAKRMNTYDDALSVEINEEGHFLVYLHVIDVAHYVKPGSLMFEEAKKRSRKIYMHNLRYARNMLPEQLSHGICSFIKGQDRLAKTVSLEFNSKGELCGYDFFDSVINVKENFSTRDADSIYEAGYDMHNPDFNGDFITEFALLNQINNYIKKAQFIGVNSASTNDMHGVLINIIEYANEHVANHFPTLPFIYKTFKYPTKKEIIKKVTELEKKEWHRINHLNYIKNNIVEKVLTYYKLPHVDIYESAVADLLTSSRYFFSTKNKGHFNYGIERYTHINSPARSFVNLVNQTLFDLYHSEFDSDLESIEELEGKLEEWCKEYNEKYEVIEKLDHLCNCSNDYERELHSNTQGTVTVKNGRKIMVSVPGGGMYRVFSDDPAIKEGTELIIKINRSPDRADRYNAKILYYKNKKENI